MAKNIQVIFMKGKEAALKSLFENKFKYLAIGYDPLEEGLEDAYDIDIVTAGFQELSPSDGYERIPLSVLPSDTTPDDENKKVLIKLSATLPSEKISNHKINQMAIVDNQEINPADTNYFSATTFPTFNKTENSSITFVIGVRL